MPTRCRRFEGPASGRCPVSGEQLGTRDRKPGRKLRYFPQSVGLVRSCQLQEVSRRFMKLERSAPRVVTSESDSDARKPDYGSFAQLRRLRLDPLELLRRPPKLVLSLPHVAPSPPYVGRKMATRKKAKAMVDETDEDV